MTRTAFKLWSGLALGVAVVIVLATAVTRRTGEAIVAERLAVAEALGAGAAESGYARAYGPRLFEFPLDHGPHPQFRTEWWYFTGNLTSATGRRFGYQLTFFRVAFSPAPRDPLASAWRTRDVYMAHFALTDVLANSFHAHERHARTALDLAGARAAPFAVWLEDWRVESASGADFPWRLQARADDITLDLELSAAKPPVLQGERGLSRKSSEPGNASYYYSLPRLATRGEVRIGTERHRVQGGSWLDREWSTSALAPEQVGWDWFALQLSDGRELMFYRLRRRDGSIDPTSAGALIGIDGGALALDPSAITTETLAHWRSPRTGVRYPARWRITVPEVDLQLTVEPLLNDQELDLLVRYWEGAVSITGASGQEPVTGVGYVELTGYGDTQRQLTRR